MSARHLEGSKLRGSFLLQTPAARLPPLGWPLTCRGNQPVWPHHFAQDLSRPRRAAQRTLSGALIVAPGTTVVAIGANLEFATPAANATGVGIAVFNSGVRRVEDLRNSA